MLLPKGHAECALTLEENQLCLHCMFEQFMQETRLPADLQHRKEDEGLITGRSHFVDDLKPPAGRPPALHMAVVRSPYAHAEIQRIQLDAARSLPGVFAAFTGAELVSDMHSFETLPMPGLKKPVRRP